MRNAIFVLVAVAILISLFVLPIIPTPALFQLSASSFDCGEADCNFTGEMSDEVLSIVSAHDGFAVDTRYPGHLSLKDYLFMYTEIGVLSIGHSSDGFPDYCLECSVLVHTGMNCRGLCGVGNTFYLAHLNEKWKVMWVGKWAS